MTEEAEYTVAGLDGKDAIAEENGGMRAYPLFPFEPVRNVEKTKSEKWLMPHIRPGCAVQYGAGRVFFAGEIAGFLNPMGEGISAGMESGHCLACAVAEHFDDMDMIYQDYRQSSAALKNYMERQWSFVAGMADTFTEMKL